MENDDVIAPVSFDLEVSGAEGGRLARERREQKEGGGGVGGSGGRKDMVLTDTHRDESATWQREQAELAYAQTSSHLERVSKKLIFNSHTL